MITEEDFDKLGDDEKEKQARFREMIREGMKGMAAELNVEELTWVAGIHRNTENPHAHIVMSKNVIELGTERPKKDSSNTEASSALQRHAGRQRNHC